MRRARLLCLGLLFVFAFPAAATIRLPTNRATILTVGPFVDYSDGVTPETAMTATNITVCLTKDSDAGGSGTAPTIVINTTATASGGSNDMVHLTGDTVGLYSLELTAAQLNFVGRGKLVLSDPDVMCPWWTDIIVEPNNVYDSSVSGTDYLGIDVAQWLGTTAEALADSADNQADVEAAIDTKLSDIATAVDVETNSTAAMEAIGLTEDYLLKLLAMLMSKL